MASMSTPTRGAGASFSNLMLSPKLAMPTASPQVTRLDRVLDLVTEHEAHFREQELRVVDISKRVAAVGLSLPPCHSRGHGPSQGFTCMHSMQALTLAPE
jgi:hypothetical protein